MPVNSRTLLLGWIGLGTLYVVLLALFQREEISKELAIRSAALTNQVSQRADQHDAHLTGLSALAVSGQEPNAALFIEVVTAIRQFYPRVTAVDLVSLQDDTNVITSRDGLSDTHALHSAIQLAASRSTGSLELMHSPQHEDRYLIIKRVPNSSAARFALSFEIDTRRLVNIDPAFWRRKNIELSISMPDGKLLSRFRDEQQAQSSEKFKQLTVTNVLGSRTQPLALSSIIYLSADDLLPIGPLLLGLFFIGSAWAVTTTIFRLYAKSRRAETRARLGEHDARISHASRVNSLGELSSGIAHELTQPLTAILSQSQAGVRLVKDHGVQQDTVIGIFNANVTQAKRASNILARLREWTKHSTESWKPVAVNGCIQNVLLLLDAEIRKQCINLTAELSSENPYINCDPVEMEQVVFNLIRNALDKRPIHGRTGLSILITTSLLGDQVVLNIKDDGALVDHKILDRILEPFVTTRDNGMGLGLALCDRIVNRMEGRIEISNAEDGVVARVTLPTYVQYDEDRGD